jgi:hypothetical protein
MPIVIRQGSIGSTGNSDDMGGRGGSLKNARLSYDYNFIGDAIDLIEEDNGNLTVVNDDEGDSSDEETRIKRR